MWVEAEIYQVPLRVGNLADVGYRYLHTHCYSSANLLSREGALPRYEKSRSKSFSFPYLKLYLLWIMFIILGGEHDCFFFLFFFPTGLEEVEDRYVFGLYLCMPLIRV